MTLRSPAATRLIPACAGKTPLLVLVNSQTRAHPRVCGENLNCCLLVAGRHGSSPRVRGKRAPQVTENSTSGLIPACAGKTESGPVAFDMRGAHPRVCGENMPLSGPLGPGRGSSPRVRGKRRASPGRRRSCGLIPACAGKTPVSLPREAGSRAHPRVCGENVRGAREGPAHDGSSPRVRGKLTEWFSVGIPGRLIPACAGKTRPTWSDATNRAAHPRVCGENPFCAPTCIW